MRGEDLLQGARVAFDCPALGDRLGFAAGVAGDELRQLENDARGVFAELGGVGREPAVDGTVHQLEAEEEHEDGRGDGDQSRAHDHACSQAGAESTAAPIYIDLENVALEKKKQNEQQKKNNDGESG